MNAWHGLSDVEMIFVVLAAVYCWECACWIRGNAICLSSGRGKCRLLRSWPPFENERGRLTFTNPLPLASSFVCQPWPVPMDRQGIAACETAPTGSAAGVNGEWLPYERIESVSQQERDVLVNGKTAATLASEAHAAFVAARLRTVVDADESHRRQAIEKVLDETTDVEQIARRLDEFRQATSSLRFCCMALATYAFVGGPLLYYTPALASWRNAGWYLAGFLSVWLYLVYRYVEARRTIRCEERGKRLRQAAMLLFSPASAMRAAESLSRDLLAGAEPLAAAAVVCSRDDFAPFAEMSLRSALYPITDQQFTADAAAHLARQWFAEQRARRLRRVIDAAGLDSATLLEAPRPSHDATSYCPRCLRQYSLDDGQCPACPGVALVPFASAPAAQNAAVVAPVKDDPGGRLAEAAADEQ